jgi:drug/metabolite transporter (DMT)-like permease
LMSTLSYAGANIYARRFLGGYHPFAIASAQTIGSLVLALPLALLFDRPWTLANPSAGVWFAGIAMGLLGSGLAPLCHFTILHRSGAVNAMLSSIVVPVTPVLLGWGFLGEQLNMRELIGAFMIAAALMIIDGRIVAWGAKRFRLTGRHS